jgi:hypothetical protein
MRDGNRAGGGPRQSLKTFGFRNDYEGWKLTQQETHQTCLQHNVLEVTMRDGNTFQYPVTMACFFNVLEVTMRDGNASKRSLDVFLE